jgi:O-6-methylguanine DNA methyltransferase
MRQKSKPAIGTATCQTARGWVGIAWSEQGLVAISLPQPTEEEALAGLPVRGDAVPPLPSWLGLESLADRLRRYFEGEEVVFDEPLDRRLGTRFQRRVWAATRAIPRGKTWSYGQVARMAGAPRAARAVGQAMARNPWPIVVPCHRVVGHDGRLTGYGGGLELKKGMLDMEGALR